MKGQFVWILTVLVMVVVVAEACKFCGITVDAKPCGHETDCGCKNTKPIEVSIYGSIKKKAHCEDKTWGYQPDCSCEKCSDWSSHHKRQHKHHFDFNDECSCEDHGHSAEDCKKLKCNCKWKKDNHHKRC